MDQRKKKILRSMVSEEILVSRLKAKKNLDGIQLHREPMKICIWLFRMTQNGSMLKL